VEKLKQDGTADELVQAVGGADAFDEILQGVFDPLIKELQQSTAYYKTQERIPRVEHLYLCGGCSGLPRLQSVIARRAGMPVQLWNPLHHIEMAPEAKKNIDVDTHGPSMAVALGLAFRKDV
jgi:Tfp pilus assembly PilM family ATPase